MLYCFNSNYGADLNNTDEMKKAFKDRTYITYDEKNKVFLDQFDKEINIDGFNVTPRCGVEKLETVVKAIEQTNAKIKNSWSNIEKIQNWTNYIDTNRTIITVNARKFKDEAFLTYLIETFGFNKVFFRTKNREFVGVAYIKDLVDSTSVIRKAIDTNPDYEFVISNYVNIDVDDIGAVEYRAIIDDNVIMNISRATNKIFHSIPKDVVLYINNVIKEFTDFPKTYVIDIFSYDGKLDILNIRPLETSKMYLYNTIISYSSDLLHINPENLPEEKDKDIFTSSSLDLSYFEYEKRPVGPFIQKYISELCGNRMENTPFNTNMRYLEINDIDLMSNEKKLK